jgi:surface antigen
MRRVAVAACGALALLCAGCQSIGAFAGATAGVVSSAATANPAVGIGIGIAVQAATDEAISRTMRGLHQDQQDAMAAIAGETPIGTMREWRVKHLLPLENGQGRVLVLRNLDTPLTQCREFAFSVMADGAEQWFIASACRQAQGWKWASAEPGTARWGSLQ